MRPTTHPVARAAAAAAVALTLSAGPAIAAPTDSSRGGSGGAEAPPRTLALGVSLLQEHGFGGVARLRVGRAGFEVAGAWFPYYAFASACCNVAYDLEGWRVTASVVGLLEGGKGGKLSHGPRFGYFYDGVLRHGLIVGYQVELPLSEWLVLEVGAGIQYTPSAGGPVRAILERTCGEPVELDVLAYLRPYVGVSALFYVF